MTLAQLGAEVIRVDPVGGAADYHRWPVTEGGDSIYWAGLNKGKRSVAVDVRSPDGQDLVQRLIADSGVLITNVAGRQWHSYDTLVRVCPDLIHVEVSGRADGGTGVDYTVNAGIGFPLVTGPVGLAGPVNHVLPAWDVACGIVRRTRRHRGAAAPRHHGHGPADQHPVGERRARDGGKPQLPDRGDDQRHAEGADRQLDLRPVRSAVHQQRRRLVHGRRAHRQALPGPHRDDRNGESRCCAGSFARCRFHRRGRPVSAPRRAHRSVHRVVHRTDRRGGGRRAVGDVDPVGALPDLRRRGHRGQGDVQPALHRTRSAAVSGGTWRPACRCRSTASTRLRSPHRRSAITPPPYCGTGWG